MQHIIPPAFDSLVFAAVAREIQQDFLDGRITGLVQPDAYTVGLRPRTRRARRRAGRAVHPFAVQLRARLDGGRLRAAGLEPFERVLTLTCETLEGDVHLVLGGMGRHSNMFLVDGERVAGAFKTVTPAMSRVRPIAVGQRYTRPPRTRPTPSEVDTAALRAGLDPEEPAPPQAADALLAAVRELAATVTGASFTPVWYEDEDSRPAAYAAIPLLPYGGWTERADAAL